MGREWVEREGKGVGSDSPPPPRSPVLHPIPPKVCCFVKTAWSIKTFRRKRPEVERIDWNSSTRYAPYMTPLYINK